MLPPSRREQQILNIYKEYAARNDKLPRIQDIAELLGVSKTCAHTYIGRLIKKGYLIRESQRVLTIVNLEVMP